jgi:hypothetical protein
MSHRLISGALRKVAWIGAAGAVAFALAAPFSAAPSALADPKPPPPAAAHTYNVTLSCATISGMSDNLASFTSGWRWYQGGINGTVLAAGSLTNGPCPPAGGGTSTVTFSGTQPDKADTLFAWVEGGMGGCGGVTFGGPISFTPRSPVSLSWSMVNKSPCSYQTNLPKATVTATFALQS